MSKTHEFRRPIRRVAVIGTGAAGVTCIRHLAEAGIEVAAFERQSGPGGIWTWSGDVRAPVTVPTPPPSRGAFAPQDTRTDALVFSPPNPVYESLSNNVPTAIMAFKDFNFPDGTPANIKHDALASYLKDYVNKFDLNKHITYSTRLDDAVRLAETENSSNWKLFLTQRTETGDLRRWTETVDALVVATGHYNAPYIPYFPGAQEWVDQWPERIFHSSGYRSPQRFEGKAVLIVGIGTSGIDIAHDLNGKASAIFMVGKEIEEGPSSYVKQRSIQRRMAPTGTTLLPEIKAFHSPGEDIASSTIELKDGTYLKGIDSIIFATGYQYSFPFLRDLHADAAAFEDEAERSERLLVTDGRSVQNVYRDIFYIPDPTLAFLGLSINTAAFSFFEYQSITVARVFSGHARLPDLETRRRQHNEHLAACGQPRFVNLIGSTRERTYVQETVDWLNKDAEGTGLPEIQGHSEEWLKESDKTSSLILAKYATDTSAW